jgi:hypothetical protein
MPSGLLVSTARVNTGNVRTNYDPITPAQTAAGVGVVPGYVYLNLPCPLGSWFLDVGGSDSVSGTLTQLPAGSQALYKYVLYKSTTNPALVAAPGLVYYTDETQTVVSGAAADGYTANGASLAGIMMLNTTDNANVTATLLNNGGNGSGVWICIGGFVKAATSVTSTVGGSGWIGGGATAFTPTYVAAGTAPGYPKNMTALTAISSGVSDCIVNIVPIC